MPVLDGLQLIKRIKNEHPDVEFIILSGYGEFDLANTAMKYGVKHYLLKPCNENTIVEVLEDVTDELKKRRSIDEYVKKSKYNFDKILPLVKEQFFRDYIMNKSYTQKECKYYQELLKIGGARMRLVLMKLECNCTLEEAFALYNTANEQDKGEIILLNTVLSDRVLLLINALNEDQTVEFIRVIRNAFDYNKKEINAFYSDVIRFEEIPNAYKEAKKCLEYTFYLGGGSIITKRDIDNHYDNDGNYELDFSYDRISSAVKCGNARELNLEIGRFFDMLKVMKCEITVARTYCFELFFNIIRQGRPGDMEAYTGKMQKINKFEMIDQIYAFISQIGNELTQTNYEGIISKNKKMVNNIISHMYENIDNRDLSLKWLANNHLYMNVGYLGKLFTKATGEKFSNYLSRIRIEKAKELIDTWETEKVYEVAEKVGLGDNPQYFSHVFKIYTGLTPTEYIKRKKAGIEKYQFS
jgi:two-component system response regulator YesN